MYFLEQIKGQFISQVVAYNIDGPKGIEDSEKPKTEVEGGEAAQAKNLAEKSVKLGKEMENNEKRFSETSKALKGSINGNNDKKEIEAVSTKEALSSVQPRSQEEKKMVEIMKSNDMQPQEIQEALFQKRIKAMAEKKLSLGEETEITEALFMNSVIGENKKVDPQMFQEARALGIIDMEGESSEEIIAKIREGAGDFSDMIDFAEKNGFKSPENKEELVALHKLFKQQGKETMSPEDIAKLPKDKDGNPSPTINDAHVSGGNYSKPRSSSSRYEGTGSGTSYGNGVSSTMEGVSNIDSSELLPFVDKIANKLNVEPAAVKAVVSVESAGKINATRFEPHIYERAQNGKYGPGDRKMLSTSYGAFQIMGFNYKTCGFDSVEKFVEGMKTPEGQMDAFGGFIEGNPRIHKALQQKDWATFAHGYNGPAYKQNNYDNKMAAAYNKYSKQGSQAMV